ncbi:MAG: GNAT family N-acetyltransferase [Bacteroidetes bacterium 4484_276]|nr:MAG: GNAT family N-acetyltransferase [Bacteroidetes bacterium 4484_276]
MFLLDKCIFRPLSKDLGNSLKTFDCGNQDLNDFFANDCFNYANQLIGKTYCFTLDDNPSEIVCMFTVSNDSIKANTLPNSRRKKVTKNIPQEKRMRSYPSVLIGRLGVSVDFKKRGIGKELINFIKTWFIDDNNKTGCRFLVVDSYNEAIPLNYYKSNGFIPLFSTEEQEKEYMGLGMNDILKTRLLYFDLILLKPYA